MAISTSTTTTITPAATMAAAKVFGIMELLEMILEQTEFRDLLRCQRVNKNFGAVIKDSTRLQRCMSWLQIDNPKVMHTPLSFQFHFKAQNGHGSSSMRHTPFYGRNESGGDTALIIQFQDESTSPRRGFGIAPHASQSWRKMRVSNTDEQVYLMSSMWRVLPSSATLGDLYDELCRQQNLAREHWRTHEAQGGYVEADKARDFKHYDPNTGY